MRKRLLVAFVALFCLFRLSSAHAGECLYIPTTKFEGYDAQRTSVLTSIGNVSTGKQPYVCYSNDFVVTVLDGQQIIMDIKNKQQLADPRLLGASGCAISGKFLYMVNGSDTIYRVEIGKTTLSSLKLPVNGIGTITSSQSGVVTGSSGTNDIYVVQDFDKKTFQAVTVTGATFVPGVTSAGSFIFANSGSEIYKFEIDASFKAINLKKLTAPEKIRLFVASTSDRLVLTGLMKVYVYDFAFNLKASMSHLISNQAAISTTNFMNGGPTIAVPSGNDIHFYDKDGKSVGSKWTFGSKPLATIFAPCPSTPTCTTGQTQPCPTGSDVGECKKGTQTCTNGAWGACTGDVTPQTEVCDGKDNNCDGQVDENWTTKGTTCSLGKGACAANGNQVCKSDGTGVECDATPGQPSQETCDGTDEDCDGTIDNNVAPRNCTSPCGSGKETCQNGTWGSCDAPKTCDCKAGETQACTAGQGECSQGTRTCDSTTLKWGQCVATNQPSQEVCGDGKDNDCDGTVDNGCPTECQAGMTRPCQDANAKGECQNGTQGCLNGAWGSCDPGQPVAEVCDGKDNDCDGKIDQGLSRACTLSCGNTGKELCVNGKWGGDVTTTWAACNAQACPKDCNPLETRPCDHVVCGTGKGVEECRADGQWAGTCGAPPRGTNYMPVTAIQGQGELIWCGPGVVVVRGPKVQGDTSVFFGVRVKPSPDSDTAYSFGIQGDAIVNGPSLSLGLNPNDGYRLVTLESQAQGFAKVKGIQVEIKTPGSRSIAGLAGTVVGAFKDPKTPWVFTWYTFEDLAILDLEGTDSKGNPIAVKGVRVTGSLVEGAHHFKLIVDTKRLDGLTPPVTREQPTPPEDPQTEADAGPAPEKSTTDITGPDIGCGGCSTGPNGRPSLPLFFFGILALLVLRRARMPQRANSPPTSCLMSHLFGLFRPHLFSKTLN